MIRPFSPVLLGILLLVVPVAPGWSQSVGSERRALIITNTDYKFLPSPAGEANDLPKILEKLKFDVQSVRNLDAAHLVALLDTELPSKLHQGDTLFLYYSGYASQIGGINCLVPVDFNPKAKADQGVLYNVYGLDLVQQVLDRKQVNLAIMVLDASFDSAALAAKHCARIFQGRAGPGKLRDSAILLLLTSLRGASGTPSTGGHGFDDSAECGFAAATAPDGNSDAESH